MERRVTLLLVLVGSSLPFVATWWALATRPPEPDDERWFENVVRHNAVEAREKLRATPLRPVIGLFSNPPRRGCVVHVDVSGTPLPAK